MIHREGHKTLFIALLVLGLPYVALDHWVQITWLTQTYLVLALVLYVLVLQFFRNPPRTTVAQSGDVIAPADGKVVLIEEIEETECFHDQRKMISIFMSPLNVHVNRVPVAGKVTYAKYHPGKYLVAWHPKSSTLNERTTVVVDDPATGPVLFRQIAGAVARRIALYCRPGQAYQAGDEFGFIRFGSRMDIYLPLDAEICVKIGDRPRGGETVIARIPARKA
ncbi:MAG: phosphatidylserine decarboxylase family protein [Bacteroidetes bacterium]|jgi:phosphatidylserine decarboxylase|nr:MAG: phosphatidylserine decarboxylase [Cryomorphaceae bacterium BACL23 MAG-120924-bin60]MBL6627090.1 phosphatidylserine decarboxylase family protein [Cryomorphaceae bacterium]MDA0363488.1 phosphatidylserine decarboxylase family protein [Bacteroidota bacterium]NCZ94720.1 phosphatidylserine decarboxylase family protein [Flavobacteriia bacterium]MDA0828739.1 phosphatidylserine decarboxylase family protein [Bacteroidota bacterium]